MVSPKKLLLSRDSLHFKIIIRGMISPRVGCKIVTEQLYVYIG